MLFTIPLRSWHRSTNFSTNPRDANIGRPTFAHDDTKSLRSTRHRFYRRQHGATLVTRLLPPNNCLMQTELRVNGKLLLPSYAVKKTRCRAYMRIRMPHQLNLHSANDTGLRFQGDTRPHIACAALASISFFSQRDLLMPCVFRTGHAFDTIHMASRTAGLSRCRCLTPKVAYYNIASGKCATAALADCSPLTA